MRRMAEVMRWICLGIEGKALAMAHWGFQALCDALGRIQSLHPEQVYPSSWNGRPPLGLLRHDLSLLYVQGQRKLLGEEEAWHAKKDTMRTGGERLALGLGLVGILAAAVEQGAKWPAQWAITQGLRLTPQERRAIQKRQRRGERNRRVYG